MTHFQRGDRVLLTRRWAPGLKRREGYVDVTVEGTVESWGATNDIGEGFLILTDVAAEFRGGWAAPSSDCNQTTTLAKIPQST